MVGGDVGFLIDGDEEGGDIAVSADDFWVLADEVEVNAAENSGATVSSSDGEDGFDFWVRKCPVEVVKALFIGATEVGPGLHEVGGVDGNEAEGFGTGSEFDEVFGLSDGASGGDEGDFIARFEGFGGDLLDE